LAFTSLICFFLVCFSFSLDLGESGIEYFFSFGLIILSSGEKHLYLSYPIVFDVDRIC